MGTAEVGGREEADNPRDFRERVRQQCRGHRESGGHWGDAERGREVGKAEYIEKGLSPGDIRT